jgi:hypothetical protein
LAKRQDIIYAEINSLQKTAIELTAIYNFLEIASRTESTAIITITTVVQMERRAITFALRLRVVDWCLLVPKANEPQLRETNEEKIRCPCRLTGSHCLGTAP